MNLPDAIAKGYNLLVVGGEQVFLARPGAVLAGINARPPLVMDLAAAWRYLRKKAGDRDEFSLQDLATATALPYRTIHGWFLGGDINPSVRDAGKCSRRVFSFSDLYFAVILSSLRRNNVPMPVARGAVRYISSTEIKLPIEENTATTAQTASVEDAS